MVNEHKIRIMTQAAMYEDSMQYRRDFFIKRYYKNDYIALNRFITKFWATLFYCMFLVVYVFQLVYVQGVDLLHFDYSGFAVRVVILYLIISVVISVLTSIVYGNRYAKAEKRMKNYFEKLSQIDRFQS